MKLYLLEISDKTFQSSRVSCPQKYCHASEKEYLENFREKPIEDIREKSKLYPSELALGDWKRILTEEQFKVTRLNCTEHRNVSPSHNNKEKGVYHCVGCGSPLFNSHAKYNSGSGWPSFYEPIRTEAVKELTDFDIGYARTDIRCSRCGAHLGHMFHDGPPPTGLRYCINGIAVDFVKNTVS